MMDGYYTEVLGVKVPVPVRYPNARVFMALFPASTLRAKKLINNDRLHPIPIFPGRCFVAITVFDYIESPVGPYREIAISIPVLLDSRVHLPILPLLFPSFFKGVGFCALLLGMNTELAREHSKQIFGYPTYESDLKIEIKEEGNMVFISSTEDNKTVFDLTMNISQGFKRRSDTHKTFVTKERKIVEIKLHADAKEALSLGKKSNIQLGDHSISKILMSLNLGSKSYININYLDAVEILDSPEEVSAL